MAEEPAEAIVEGELNEEKEVEQPEYCIELSEEQLKGFYEKCLDNEEVKFMALNILRLPDFKYEGNIAFILDYFVGILMFAQEELLSVPHTLLIYQLAQIVLENIKAGASFKKTEKTFKDQIFKWSVKVKYTNHVPRLTTIELQKIVPFFMTTVFQHFKLYKNCLHRESLHRRYHEEVWIETALTLPLHEADNQEEIDADNAAKAAYERAWAEWEAARLAAEAKALWDFENPPEPKRPPNSLEEAIELTVRDKVEEVTQLMLEQYEQRAAILLARCQTLDEKK